MLRVDLYTDGACSGNPGDGGWAAILLHKDIEKEISGFVPNTTNNRMELQAIIEGFKALKKPSEVYVYSDSAYVINAFLQDWIGGWTRNNWINSQKKPVLNIDLWKKLVDLSSRHKVSWVKVKGHSDNEYNNRCDKLAVEAIKKHQKVKKSKPVKTKKSEINKTDK